MRLVVRFRAATHVATRAAAAHCQSPSCQRSTLPLSRYSLSGFRMLSSYPSSCYSSSGCLSLGCSFLGLLLHGCSLSCLSSCLWADCCSSAHHNEVQLMRSGLLHHPTVTEPSEDVDPSPDQEKDSTPGGLHATTLQFTPTQAAPGDGHEHGTPHIAPALSPACPHSRGESPSRRSRHPTAHRWMSALLPTADAHRRRPSPTPTADAHRRRPPQTPTASLVGCLIVLLHLCLVNSILLQLARSHSLTVSL